MIKVILLIILSCSVKFFVIGQHVFDWVEASVGSGMDYSGDICVDGGGNTLACGSYSDTLYEYSNNNFALNPADSLDGFILKRSPIGNVLWFKSIQGTGKMIINSITVDSDDNVLITGSFTGTFDLDPNTGSSLITSTNFQTDIFIAKYNPVGDYLWGYSLLGSGADTGVDIETDQNNNVFIVGNFQTTVDFDASSGAQQSTAVNTSAFILKLNESGNYMFHISYISQGTSPTKYVKVTDSDVDENGNLTLVGMYLGVVDLDPGVGTASFSSHHSPVVNHEIYIVKLDLNGAYIHGGVHVSPSDGPKVYSVKSDLNNNIYYSFIFNNLIDVDPSGNTNQISNPQGNWGSVIVKLDSQGDFIWFKKTYGSLSGSLIDLFDMDIDTDNNLYFIGRIGVGVYDFDINNPGQYTLTYPNSDDLIWKLDENGNTIWVTGTLQTLTSKVATYQNDSFYRLGVSNNNTFSHDLDPSNAVHNAPNVNMRDIYYAKYKTCYHSFSTYNETACSSYEVPSGNYTVQSTGTYNDTLINSTGCDSIITLEITIIPEQYSNVDTTICFGNNYILPDGNELTNITISTIDTTSLISMGNCDSLVITNITVMNIDLALSFDAGTQQLVATNSAQSYQWLNCNENYEFIFNETSQVYSPTSNGNYSVQIENLGCIDTTDCFLLSDLSIEEQIIINSIRLYPNPSQKEVTIEFNGIIGNISISIVNSNGMKIRESNFINVSKILLDTLDIEGFFIIEINIHEKIFRLPLIVHN